MNPYVYLGAVVALVGALVGSFFYGEHVQRNADLVVEQDARIQAQASYATALKLAEDKRVAAEHALTDGQAKAEAAYSKVKGERDAAIKKTIVAVRSGDQRLYVDANSTPAACPSGVPEASANPVVPAPTSRVELSKPDAEFFVSFAGECDAVADQLSLAVQTLKNDRNLP